MTDQSDAGSVGIFSWRTNQTQEAAELTKTCILHPLSLSTVSLTLNATVRSVKYVQRRSADEGKHGGAAATPQAEENDDGERWIIVTTNE
eukprot:1195948-Prorocentrum_minimum.AAC.9